MNHPIPTALQQEVKDLLSISTIDQELKVHIESQIQAGTMSPAVFQQLLSLLREEDRLDKDMQKYSEEVLTFDPDQYLDHVQSVVNHEVVSYLESKK